MSYKIPTSVFQGRNFALGRPVILSVILNCFSTGLSQVPSVLFSGHDRGHFFKFHLFNVMKILLTMKYLGPTFFY